MASTGRKRIVGYGVVRDDKRTFSADPLSTEVDTRRIRVRWPVTKAVTLSNGSHLESHGQAIRVSWADGSAQIAPALVFLLNDRYPVARGGVHPRLAYVQLH
jgi:hypothetical protein